MSSFIEIKDLHFSYVNDLEEPPVKTEVLKGINLNIEKASLWQCLVITAQANLHLQSA